VQQGDLNTTLWVAEGVLSVALAIPNQTVLASLSVNQFESIPVDLEVQKIVILADRDEKGSNTPEAVMKSIEHHLSQGKRVFIAIPPDIGLEKCDFNDLIQHRRIEDVKASVENWVEIKQAELVMMRKEGFLETVNRLQKSSVKERDSFDVFLQAGKMEKELER